jgi:hypothetical protein
MGPGRDDGSRQADQAQAIRRAIGDHLPAVSSRPLVAFGHEQREPVVCVVLDQVEVTGRVPVTEVARPAAQIPVEILHDIFDR